MHQAIKGRVLFVTSSCPQRPGDWTSPFILDLASDLKQFGWQVEILAPHGPGLAISETINGIHIQRYRYFYPENQETVFYRGGALINMRRSPLNWIKAPAALAGLAFKLRQLLRTNTYDIAHSHWLAPQGTIAGWAAKHSGLPHVTTAHGSDVFALKGTVAMKLKAYAIFHADSVTANSTATAAAIEGIPGAKADVDIVPMAINKPTHRNGPSNGKEAGLTLLFLGRVVKEKGLTDLINALPAVIAYMPDTRLIVAGEGQDRADIEALAVSLEISHHVDFIGAVSPTNVGAYFARADVVVCPSHFEAQGLVAAEALACGKAVVATNVGGIPDTIQHEKTGLLVPAHAPEKLAASIIRLAKDNALRNLLGKNGKTYVQKHLLRPVSAAAFDKIYDRILKSHSG